jgi:hypothetical protein
MLRVSNNTAPLDRTRPKLEHRPEVTLAMLAALINGRVATWAHGPAGGAFADTTTAAPNLMAPQLSATTTKAVPTVTSLFIPPGTPQHTNGPSGSATARSCRRIAQWSRRRCLRQRPCVALCKSRHLKPHGLCNAIRMGRGMEIGRVVEFTMSMAKSLEYVRSLRVPILSFFI